MTDGYRRAPAGFTPELWQAFDRDGLVVIEDAYGPGELAAWRAALLRIQARAGAGDGFFTAQNFIEMDGAFADLIDHPAHVGLAYDLYGRC